MLRRLKESQKKKKNHKVSLEEYGIFNSVRAGHHHRGKVGSLFVGAVVRIPRRETSLCQSRDFKEHDMFGERKNRFGWCRWVRDCFG